MAIIPTLLDTEIQRIPLQSMPDPQRRETAIPLFLQREISTGVIAAPGAGNQARMIVSQGLDPGFAWILLDTSVNMASDTPGAHNWDNVMRCEWRLSDLSIRWFTEILANGTAHVDNGDGPQKTYAPAWRLPGDILYSSGPLAPLIPAQWEIDSVCQTVADPVAYAAACTSLFAAFDREQIENYPPWSRYWHHLL